MQQNTRQSIPEFWRKEDALFCDICIKWFSDVHQYQNHLTKHFGDCELPPIPNFRKQQNAIFCAACKKWLSSVKQYQSHLDGKNHILFLDSLRFQKWKHKDSQLAFGRLGFHEHLILLQRLVLYGEYHDPNDISNINSHTYCNGNKENTNLMLLRFLVCQLNKNNEKKMDRELIQSLQKKNDNNTGVILYYQYATVPDPGSLRKWQLQLCYALGLTGRIRIACEGINGTLGGDSLAIEIYKMAMKRHKLFNFCDRDFKSGLGTGSASCFPYLLVQVGKEIVSLGINSKKLQPDRQSSHLLPHEFHDIIQEKEQGKRDDIVLIDCRNFYESDVGKFRNAVTPQTRKFSQFPEYADQLINDMELEKKTVLMYCTGGIRCERGAAYLRSKGVDNVYQLNGGIHKYMQQFPNGGYWDGKLFVFDERINLTCPENPGKIISTCSLCNAPYDTYNSKNRCSNCRVLVICCETCSTKQPSIQLFCRRCHKG